MSENTTPENDPCSRTILCRANLSLPTDRLRDKGRPARPSAAGMEAPRPEAAPRSQYQALKADLHARLLDARLPDGSRVNATVPPVTIDGPTLSIRRFGRSRLRREDLLRLGMLSADMNAFLEMVVRLRKNILISGGTGAGKSTFLGALSEALPPEERIVTIEDAAELVLDQPHVVRLE